MKLTVKQLDILRHMLGINDPSKARPKPYRNHAAVDPGNSEYLELARLGMVERVECVVSTSYHWYRCTAAGEAAARASFRAFRYPKRKRRYLAFLDLSDSLTDLTFRDFLTNPEFADVRANC